MRVTMNIPIGNITYDKLPMRPKSFLFAVRLLQGVLFPPIHVERMESGNYQLCGGRHRLAAHKLVGRDVIFATFAVVEDPRADKPLVHGPSNSVPQADGYSLSEGTCHGDMW